MANLTAIVAKAQTESEAQDIYSEILSNEEVINNLIDARIDGLMVTVIYSKVEVKKAKIENTVKQLQKEAKAYNQVEVFYDVYSDRINFIGSSNTWLVDFFRRRNVIADSDRGGYSVDIKDAIKLGFPTASNSYRLKPDARKSPIAC